MKGAEDEKGDSTRGKGRPLFGRELADRLRRLYWEQIAKFLTENCVSVDGRNSGLADQNACCHNRVSSVGKDRRDRHHARRSFVRDRAE